MMLNTYYFKILDSTNIKASEFAKKGNSNLAIVADKQTRGKGRFKRKWFSGPGGLYMTISLKVDDILRVKYLTFIAAVSVSKTIRNIAGLNALVKWPNDVLIDDRKICGILAETISGRENYALIGIGANINQKKFPKEIADKATSLFLKTNKRYNTKKISNLIIKEFNKLYSQYTKSNHEKIIAEWKRYSHTLGRKIKAKTMNNTYIGKAIDVDYDCNLILRLKNGKMQKITEGDIFIA
ncbi:biotin--[acetyl-CoA-carboxylase] ligase [Candidatus Woesearchaeota archaeon]|nr:biotin--[acetyl-CoA-carboxylase] ligase [Candidatus Woesearchaeota archaeon]